MIQTKEKTKGISFITSFDVSFDVAFLGTIRRVGYSRISSTEDN